MNGVFVDNYDEMTEEDWDRYASDFETRYNEHLRSIKSSSPRRVRAEWVVLVRQARELLTDTITMITMILVCFFHQKKKSFTIVAV